ncbi:glutamyl-tRNA subunit A [Colletotrichum sojae]|uniref:Glutamyl-tRNA subunit A n=1 Tax=Colletotrichum sojae TaxID=2175907 RepID=A0A8H6MIK4_9PEZI|nr:glutamyl-tRNA subunit A [Colletotrichum sojae]
MSGSVPTNATSDSYITTNIAIPSALQQGIAVPSRLSSLPVTDNHPLAGLRFAVKDVIDVKGMKTSGGSRAYYQTYGPRNASPKAVNQLVQGGSRL